jgi:RHS repeat-associated protein
MLYRMDGTRVHFNSNFRADTIYDANNNRILLGYDGNGDLTKLTDTRNLAIYLSYYTGTHRLRRLYEAPDSTNGRFYEYRYGPSAVDTADTDKWHYELRQVLRHYPTGSDDSLVVLDRYYYDDAYRMTTKVLPTGGYGAENDTNYLANRFRGDRVVCWYDSQGRTKFQEVVNGDGDTLLYNDQVISRSRLVYRSVNPYYYPNLLDTVKIYYYDGPFVTGASHPDSSQPDSTGSYYLKVIKLKTSYTMTDKMGYKEWEYTYNPATGEADTTWYSSYDSGFNPTTVKAANGGTTTYSYLTVTDRIGGSNYIRHLSLPTKIKYPNTTDSIRIHYFRPDSVKMPRLWVPDSTINEDGLVTLYNYDSNGNDTMITAKSRVLADSMSSSAQDIKTRFGYTKGNRVRVTDPKGTHTYTNFGTGDSAAYPTQTWVDMDASGGTSPNNADIVTKYWYNANRGLLDSTGYYQDFTTGGTPTKVRYTYDALNHLAKMTYPDTSVDTMSYDKRGNVLEKWQAKNGTNYWHTAYQYDAMDHLTQVDEQTNSLGALGGEGFRGPRGPVIVWYTTRYSYNLDGNLAQMRSAHSNWYYSYNTDYTYSMGRLIKVAYADTTTDSLGYNRDGSLRIKRDRKGQWVKYIYDDNCSPCGRGRLTNKWYFGISDTINPVDSVRYAYDKTGNLTKSVFNGSSGKDSTLFAYDQLYRMKQDSAIGFNRVTKYEYDLNGNRQRMRVMDGSGNVKFYQSYPQWDRANRDTTTAVKVGNNAYTWRMQYYDTGPVKRILYPATTTLRERYNLTSRNFVANVLDSIGSNLRFRNIYEYNQVGYRSTDSLLLTKPAGGTVVGKIRWNYDNILRLNKTKYPASIASGDSVLYQYDAMGNRTVMTKNSGTTNYTYNLPDNQLLSNGGTYTYDDNGNLTQKVSGSTYAYAYDYENRLNKVKVGTDSVRFEYDGLGQRTRKVNATDTTRYTWDGLYPVVEWKNSGKLKQTFVYANGLLLGIIDSTVTTNKRYFVLHDGLGSSISMTNDSARIVRSFIYSDFGERLVDETATNTPTLNRLYAGYPWDGLPANFYWMPGRQIFDPTIGRFAQEDPEFQSDRFIHSGSCGGGSALSGVIVPQKLNLYSYVINNPLNLTDPLGLWCQEVSRHFEPDPQAGPSAQRWQKIEEYPDLCNCHWELMQLIWAIIVKKLVCQDEEHNYHLYIKYTREPSEAEMWIKVKEATTPCRFGGWCSPPGGGLPEPCEPWGKHIPGPLFGI